MFIGKNRKMKQYEYLVVYQNEETKSQFIHNEVNSILKPMKWKWNEDRQCLTIQHPRDYGNGDGKYQDNYLFVDSRLPEFDMRICGLEFYGIVFLDGEYHSDIIMFALSRMKLGVHDVEGL